MISREIESRFQFQRRRMIQKSTSEFNLEGIEPWNRELRVNFESRRALNKRGEQGNSELVMAGD